MKTKINRWFIVDQLPDGRYKVSGIEGTFSKTELKKLQELTSEQKLTIWVI